MSKFLELAVLLEEAAKALREADAALNPIKQGDRGEPLRDQRGRVRFSFGSRVWKALNRLGVNTVGELADRTADELLEVKNFGPTSLRVVQEFLQERGLALKEEPCA